MKRVFYLLPLALFLIVAIYFGVSLSLGDKTKVLPSAMLDKPAPNFNIPGLGNDKPLVLAQLKGHPVVINFFASWCVPCRLEQPLLLRLRQQDHLPIYGIAYKDKPAATQQLLASLGNPYRSVGEDPDGNLGLNFGVYGVPETYVIDSDGIIRHRFVGPLTVESVNKELIPLLKKLGWS